MQFLSGNLVAISTFHGTDKVSTAWCQFSSKVIVQNCSWQKCGHKGKDAHEGFLKIREETLGCLNNDLNVFPPSTEGYIPKALS